MCLQVSVACKQKHQTMRHLKVIPSFFHPSLTQDHDANTTSDSLRVFSRFDKWRWRQPTLFCTNGMRCNKEDKQMPQEEMTEGATSALLPSDRQMERTRGGWIPRLLTWHACQGYQTVRCEDGSRTKRKRKKKKQGAVLSQAGRARRDTQQSVRSRRPRLVFEPVWRCIDDLKKWNPQSVTAVFSVYNPTHIQVGGSKEVRAGVTWPVRVWWVRTARRFTSCQCTSHKKQSLNVLKMKSVSTWKKEGPHTWKL